MTRAGVPPKDVQLPYASPATAPSRNYRQRCQVKISLGDLCGGQKADTTFAAKCI
ncbi:hypothetical protein AGABI1DRAFT_116113 [Agaricus bisporus var. burnettii JB137-S8]|uniref:Uncharacterized protein n=1 Tax=Agaricus bisporus var. burnettii (strain JB137-S8 / ATCC MYA-4627 / FGSC 10392) TaxID=597362 RepID=K5XMR7_AGABU|nr:uncharacterized protein AGABI1DRAFT_116113 [Agaricus bisporus var. burnettii JB137-S8]EKM75905.1 hypothetical protein AGABI1DRAFT_116113 [Agaricus bisporus var. burnettii JB137-S8]